MIRYQSISIRRGLSSHIHIEHYRSTESDMLAMDIIYAFKIDMTSVTAACAHPLSSSMIAAVGLQKET